MSLKDVVLIFVGSFLFILTTITIQWSSFLMQQKAHVKTEKEEIYFQLKGIGEELENAYMDAELIYMDFTKAILREKFNSGDSIQANYTITLKKNYLEATKRKSKSRRELIEIFSKIKIYFTVNSEIQKAIEKVIVAKSIGADLHAVVEPLDPDISNQLLKARSSLEYENKRLLEISKAVSSNISEPIDLIATELQHQLDEK